MKKNFYYIIILIFNFSTLSASEIIIHFEDFEPSRELQAFYPIGNFGNRYIPTEVNSENGIFTVKIDNKVKVGIFIVVLKLDLGIPIYIEEGEKLDIYISNKKKSIKFVGQNSDAHDKLFLYEKMMYRKNLDDLFSCPNKYLKQEYYSCLEKFLENLFFVLKEDNLCDYTTYHIMLNYIKKIYLYGNKSKENISFVSKLYSKFLPDLSLIPYLFSNYSYYYFTSKYAVDSSKHFNSPDWAPYDFFLNLQDKDILGFMMQVQFATLKRIEYPFNDYCEAMREMIKYSEGYTIHNFFKDDQGCPDE